MTAPERTSVRAAGPWDAEALASMHVLSWQETYTGLLPADVLAAHARHAPQQWSRRLADPGSDSYWVAVSQRRIVGFSWARALGAGQVRPLELVGLYVLAARQGTGLADALLNAAVGEAPCLLWVAQANPRARAFYRRHGFTEDAHSRVVPEWGNLTVVRMMR